MNKGLEALQRLKDTLLAEGYWQDVLQDACCIEKELKALDVIKNKKVDCWAFITDSSKFDNEETSFAFSSIDLTEEEIVLLKEVLL